MEWTTEASGATITPANHVLALHPNDPLEPALIAFWQRILGDAIATAAGSTWMSLAFDIVERQVEGDSLGYLHARFNNRQRRACPGAAQYLLRADAYTCLHPHTMDHTTFNRKEIRWLLEQYRLLKRAARTMDVMELFGCVTDIRDLPVSAATSFGWFDLRIGQNTFGPLADEDMALLLSDDPASVDTMTDLACGIVGADVMAIGQELGAALEHDRAERKLHSA